MTEETITAQQVTAGINLKSIALINFTTPKKDFSGCPNKAEEVMMKRRGSHLKFSSISLPDSKINQLSSPILTQ